MNKRTRITGVILCSAALFGAVSVQAASVWANTLGDNVMTNAGNWTSDPLSSSSYLDIALAGSERAVMSAGMSLTVNDVRVGINSEPGPVGELEITGGYLRSNRGTGDTRLGYTGRTGIVNQSGGEWEVAQDLAVGIGGAGIYNLSGGELDNQRGTFEVDGSGSSMNISGGILKTRFIATIKDNGTFRVEGTGASSIRIGGSAAGNGTWIQNTGGLLDILIDETATGVTKTEVVGADGDVTFDTGSFLNVDFAGAANPGTFVVMEWDGDVLANNLVFAPGVDENIWSMNVDTVNKQLTVTAIPEPATLLLVGLSGLGIFAARRFRS
jgi:hypothetical protein